MPARKMRVELFDNEGNRYTVTFEGQMTRDKAVKLLDMVELLSGVPGVDANQAAHSHPTSAELTKFEKVRFLMRKHFPVAWFSSKEVQLVYEQEFKEPISLSTVSTYLARLTFKGFLLKAGSSNNFKYKAPSGATEIAVKQST
jgi:hypothetical protein